MAVSAAPNAAGNLPAAVFTFKDATGVNRQYNEPWRRVCEVTSILNGVALPVTRGNGM